MIKLTYEIWCVKFEATFRVEIIKSVSAFVRKHSTEAGNVGFISYLVFEYSYKLSRYRIHIEQNFLLPFLLFVLIFTFNVKEVFSIF